MVTPALPVYLEVGATVSLLKSEYLKTQNARAQVGLGGLNFTPFSSYFFTIEPVRYVDVKIRAKGIHVPIGLRNTSKFWFIRRETMKKSMRMTTATNTIAVIGGVV
jgi:hypothetical protein